jgi:GNAT superfamily N-acetyltransferase
MIPSGSTGAHVQRAAADDLRFINEWLRHEPAGNGAGFYENFVQICSTARGREDVWVIRFNDQAIAFHAPGVMCVREDFQRYGFGRRMVEAWIERVADNIERNVLTVQCMPETSLGFWMRMGFDQYIDVRHPDHVVARRILQRTFELPDDAAYTDVVISFYPERAEYSELGAVDCIVAHPVSGVRLPDGTIKLVRRIIGLEADEDKGKDLVIKIEVSGEERCFCKAKSEGAKRLGVRHNPHDGSFYVDHIQPGGRR